MLLYVYNIALPIGLLGNTLIHSSSIHSLNFCNVSVRTHHTPPKFWGSSLSSSDILVSWIFSRAWVSQSLGLTLCKLQVAKKVLISILVLELQKEKRKFLSVEQMFSFDYAKGRSLLLQMERIKELSLNYNIFKRKYLNRKKYLNKENYDWILKGFTEKL